MADYKMISSDLFDSRNHKIATVRGNDIFDERNHKVASIRGNDIYDERNYKVATVRGSDVYDERNSKSSSLSDVKRTIDGAMGGVTVVALWLFFVR